MFYEGHSQDVCLKGGHEGTLDCRGSSAKIGRAIPISHVL